MDGVLYWEGLLLQDFFFVYIFASFLRKGKSSQPQMLLLRELLRSLIGLIWNSVEHRYQITFALITIQLSKKSYLCYVGTYIFSIHTLKGAHHLWRSLIMDDCDLTSKYLSFLQHSKSSRQLIWNLSRC